MDAVATESLTLETTTYFAFRGYAWSRIPPIVTATGLNSLLALASARRPDSAGAEATRGLVSNGILAAAFALRTVPAWDSEGRASDYAALALIPTPVLPLIDLRALLDDRFFAEPTHDIPSPIRYCGPASSQPPLTAAGRLLCGHALTGFDAGAAGALLAAYGQRSRRWTFILAADGTATVETDPWRGVKA